MTRPIVKTRPWASGCQITRSLFKKKVSVKLHRLRVFEMIILAFERVMMALRSSHTFSKKMQFSKNNLRKQNIFFENDGFSFLRIRRIFFEKKRYGRRTRRNLATRIWAAGSAATKSYTLPPPPLPCLDNLRHAPSLIKTYDLLTA